MIKAYRKLREYSDGSYDEIVHLGEGEYVQRVTSTKDKRIYGPNTTVVLTHHADGCLYQVDHYTDVYLKDHPGDK